jgi:hypothetical protein
MFSSPAALAHTIEVYLTTLSSRGGFRQPVEDEVPPWLEEFFDDVASYDDERLAEAEDDAIDRTRPHRGAHCGTEVERHACPVGS